MNEDFKYTMIITPSCGNCASFVMRKSYTTVIPSCRKTGSRTCELCERWHPSRRTIKLAVVSRIKYRSELREGLAPENSSDF